MNFIGNIYLAALHYEALPIIDKLYIRFNLSRKEYLTLKNALASIFDKYSQSTSLGDILIDLSTNSTFHESRTIDPVINESDSQLKINFKKLSKFTIDDFFEVFEGLPVSQIMILTSLLSQLKIDIYQDIKVAFDLEDNELTFSETHQVALSEVLLDLLEMVHE